MSSCLSMCLCVHPSVRLYILLGICLLVCSEILHSNRNIEKEKGDQWIFHKNSCLPENEQKQPKMEFSYFS